MNQSLPTPPADQEEPVIIMHVDLDVLTFRTIIEPADDQVLHVYSAPRDKMAETGDIAFRRNDTDVRFYRVDYATTLRYPASTCAAACNRLPYQVFLQLDRILNQAEIAQLMADLEAMDKLPF